VGRYAGVGQVRKVRMQRPTTRMRMNAEARPGKALRNRHKGSPFIIMGNAYSLNYMDLDKVFAFPTMGCNRGLQMDRHPDYYTVVDRDPYRKELSRIKAFKGVRVLSETLFDPHVSCRRTPVQPVPDFEWFRYHAVASNAPDIRNNRWKMVTTWYCNDANVAHPQTIPVVQTDLDRFLPSGANIGYCMLQLAIAMGANPIGICGIDLKWESRAKSHFFGEGKKQGCFEFRAPRVMRFFQAAAMWAKENGIAIFNLSPKGILDCFPRITERDFHSRFVRYVERDRVCPRELLKFKSDTAIRTSGTGQHARSKSDLEEHFRKLVTGRRRNRAKARARKSAHLKRRADAIRKRLRARPKGRPK
jgi:hypothetical protein